MNAHIARRIDAVAKRPNALGAAVLNHVQTFVLTQSMGSRIDHSVIRMVGATVRVLEVRRSIAARVVQRAYLSHLYRPPMRGDTAETSYVLRCIHRDCALFAG